MSVPVHNEFEKNQGFMDNTLTLKDVQIPLPCTMIMMTTLKQRFMKNCTDQDVFIGNSKFKYNG